MGEVQLLISIKYERKETDETTKAEEEEMKEEEEKEEATQSLHYTLKLHDKALKELVNNIPTNETFCPVLSIGNSECGRTQILDGLIAMNKGIGNFFKPEDKTLPQGVYIWPYLVQTEGENLLLMKMWGVNFSSLDEEMMLQIQRVLYCLFSVTSVCLLCVEKSITCYSLNFAQKVAQSCEKSSLKMSKFFVFVENERVAKSKDLAKYLQRRPAEITEFFIRGASGLPQQCLQDLRKRLASPAVHAKYISTHQTLVPGSDQSMRAQFIFNLSMMVKLANLDLAFDDMVEKTPNFTSSTFIEEIVKLEGNITKRKNIKAATALPLFVRSVDRYKVHEAVVEGIMKDYDLKKPIIVLALMGGPGIGKSTFLNYLIKHCIESRDLPTCFATGNRGTHTTKESQVLSHPLYMPKNGTQLMIVDLEGLGGVEIEDEFTNRRQQLLIDSILVITSVPCLVIRNEKVILDWARKTIERISFLKTNFGFKVERIHLLLYDKKRKASENELIVNICQEMNNTYFLGQEVVQLRNKPNPLATNHEEMKDFFTDFLANSEFPKMFSSTPERFVNIKRLISEVRYIILSSSTNLRDLQITPEEHARIEQLLTEKRSVLETDYTSLHADDHSVTLVERFNERFQEFLDKMEEETKTESVNFRTFLKTTLETDVVEYRNRLEIIDADYQLICDASLEELQICVESQLTTYYRESWKNRTFMNRANEYEQKFIDVQMHYSGEREKITALLTFLDETRSTAHRWIKPSDVAQAKMRIALAVVGAIGEGAIFIVKEGARLLNSVGMQLTDSDIDW